MIGVIADDLTGAAELGAVAWHHGLTAEVVLDRGSVSTDSAVVCLDTHSRSQTALEAARRAAAAAARMQEAGMEWVYKKTDSVLRGQVVAELNAVLQQLGLKRALLLPANPGLGRVIRDGRYFINGQPLDQTEFARDPEYPRKSAFVSELLSVPAGPAVQVCQRGTPLPDSGIMVGEVDSLIALNEWAACRSPDMLLAGGAQFFAALLAAAGHRVKRPASANALAPGGSGRELFVCGTTSNSGLDFVQNARTRGTPVFSLPAELARGGDFRPAAVDALARRAAEALLKNRRAILCVGLPQVAEASIAQRLAVQLAKAAEAVLNLTDVDDIYAEGGATALELAVRMGWARLKVVGELSLGVATLAVDGPRPGRLTVKPGSYVWPASVQNPAPQAAPTFGGGIPQQL